jgi:hypothetical protein
MNTRIGLFLLVLLVAGYIYYSPVENFSFEDGMLVFKRLNGSLIKKIKIDSFYTMSGKDIENLFKKDETIRVYVPPNHTVQVIYKLKNGGFSRTVDLPDGAHDLKNKLKDGKEIIDQIDARISYTVSPGAKLGPGVNKILVVDKAGETLFTSDSDANINWDLIYTDYGLDDYYVVYPWGRRLYYYYNYPFYRKYRGYNRRPMIHYRNRRWSHNY